MFVASAALVVIMQASPVGDAVAPPPSPGSSQLAPTTAAPIEAAPPASPSETTPIDMAPAPAPTSQPDSPHGEPTAEPPPSDVVYVDHRASWQPSPQRTVVVTRVVHRPAPAPRHYEPEPHFQPARSFMGLSLRGTTTNNNPSMLTGARVGFTFDDRFTIGGAFYSLTARYAGPIVDARGNELGLRMGYGGVLLAWNLYKGRVVHFALESMAGAGAACIDRDKRSYGRWNCIEKVGFVSLEPGLELGFTITDWIRTSATLGHRFVTREAWRPPSDFTLSGPYVGLNIDVGWFGDDR